MLTNFDLETGLCITCPSIHRVKNFGRVMTITDHLLTTTEQFTKPLSNKACISYIVIEAGGLDSIIRMTRKLRKSSGKRGEYLAGQTQSY